MKYRHLFVFTTTLILSFNLLTLPSLSQTITKCEQHQEIFTFQIPNYPIQHQGGAVLNLKIAYRFTPEAIAKNDYPDLVPIKKEIDKFLVNYPNEVDYWEIVNKKLVQFILDKYPQMSSLNVEMGFSPTSYEPFFRSSIIHSTRPGNCPIRL